MVSFELRKDAVLSDDEKKALAEARKFPTVYDEDCPEMTEQMEQAFVAARKAKPYRGERLTLYVSPVTMKKVRALGEDYMAILGSLLDKAVNEYQAG